MHISLHVGAHFTEEELLINNLRKNQDILAQHGVSVPAPSRYRKLFRQTLLAMENSEIHPDTHDVIIETLLDDNDVSERIIFSNPHYFGAPRFCVRKNKIYFGAAHCIALTADLFAADEVELFLAIRNPATFLPQLFANSPQETVPDFFRKTDPEMLRWSNTLHEIHRAAPDIGITVWCNEDSPMIWGEIQREIAGVDDHVPLSGEYDLFNNLLTSEGRERLHAYIADNPRMNEVQKRRVMLAFYDKYATEHAEHEDVEMPGWDTDYVERLTQLYEDDVAVIQSVPNVVMIAP